MGWCHDILSTNPNNGPSFLKKITFPWKHAIDLQRLNLPNQVIPQKVHRPSPPPWMKLNKVLWNTMEEKTLGIHSIKHGNKNHTLAPAENVSNSYRVIILLTQTNPNKAPVTGNPSKLPYQCIVYFSLKWVTLNHPCKFRRKKPTRLFAQKNLT